jgi:hypothetical protein
MRRGGGGGHAAAAGQARDGNCIEAVDQAGVQQADQGPGLSRQDGRAGHAAVEEFDGDGHHNFP